MATYDKTAYLTEKDMLLVISACSAYQRNPDTPKQFRDQLIDIMAAFDKAETIHVEVHRYG